MSNCPNCGKKLKLTDVSQFCPHCGANLRFINFEENFYREAKYAELTQANVKAKLRRFKCAFVGSKLTVVRLAAAFLPVLSLLIPAGGYSIDLPLLRISRDFGLMWLIAAFTDGDLAYVTGMTGAGIVGPGFTALRNAVFGYAGAAAGATLVLLGTVLCFLSVKNMQKVLCAFACLGAALSGCAYAAIFIFAKQSGGCAMLDGKTGFGLFVAVAAFAAVFAVNLILHKKGVPVKYDEGMEARAAVYRRFKRGEVRLEELPLPVVETQKTRELERRIAAEEEKYRKELEEEAEDDG